MEKSQALIANIHDRFIGGIKIKPPIKVSDWADQYRILSSQSSSEPGRWRTHRTPYLREIMDLLSPDVPIRRVSIMKGHQVGYTEGILMNFLGYTIAEQPAPTLFVAPTLKQMQKIMFQKIEPMINDSPIVNEKINKNSKMNYRNTVIHKDFTGGFLSMAGANIASDLAGTSIRNLLLDEVDRMTGNTEGEGSPVELAVGRTAAYSRKKIIMGSTPVDEETSVINRWFHEGDQRYYHVPCPHCEALQTLVIERLKLDENDDPYYECEGCSEAIYERHKTLMLERGKWIPEAKPIHPSYRSYHLNALYSPVGFLSWADVLRAKQRAQDDEYYARSFRNLYLGLPSEQSVIEIPQPHIISARAEANKGTTPPLDSALMTCGVDIQKERIEALVVGFHRRSIYIASHHVFHGEVSIDDEPWDELYSLMSSHKLHAMAVDSGYMPHRVHNWKKSHHDKRIKIIKGVGSADTVISMPKIMEVNDHGRKIKTGNRYHTVDTSYLKDEIYSRLMIGDPDHPEYIWFPKGLSEEFYAQLCSERKVIANINNEMDRTGAPRYKWMAIRHRNEVLDMLVYAMSMYYLLGGNKQQNRWESFIARRNMRR